MPPILGEISPVGDITRRWRIKTGRQTHHGGPNGNRRKA
jgi:hypothetical protein